MKSVSSINERIADLEHQMADPRRKGSIQLLEIAAQIRALKWVIET